MESFIGARVLATVSVACAALALTIVIWQPSAFQPTGRVALGWLAVAAMSALLSRAEARRVRRRRARARAARGAHTSAQMGSDGWGESLLLADVGAVDHTGELRVPRGLVYDRELER
jgi:hypothetical protein